jgi:hypothetical protein
MPDMADREADGGMTLSAAPCSNNTGTRDELKYPCDETNFPPRCPQ